MMGFSLGKILKTAVGFLPGPWAGVLSLGADLLSQNANKNAAASALGPYTNLGAYGADALKRAGAYNDKILGGHVDPAAYQGHESNQAQIGATTGDVSRELIRRYDSMGNPGKGVVSSTNARLAGDSSMAAENNRYASEIIGRKQMAADNLAGIGSGAANIGRGAASEQLGVNVGANNTMADSVGGVLGGLYEDKITKRMHEILAEQGVPPPSTDWSGSGGGSKSGMVRMPDGTWVSVEDLKRYAPALSGGYA
jgi:hypothetical protein